MVTSTDPRRWLALGALALGLLVFGLDMMILTVANPTLATELDASTAQLQWFANAYTLVLAAGLLPAGMLGDRFGQKKLIIGALALFGLASIGCAYAGSAELLIVARAALGVGAAFMVPLSMSLLTVLFSAEERGKAIAVWSTAMVLGIPLGPVLGGWLLDNFWWGSVFLINVPIVALGIAALAWLLPSTPGSRDQRFDFPGAVLASVGLLGLTYGLVEAGPQGWGSAAVLVPVAGGALVLAGFVLWTRRARQPLVDLRLFSSPGFTWGSVLATMASFGMMGALFVLPLYFQAVLGTDAFGTGLRVLPIVGGLLVGVLIANRVTGWLGAKVNVATGFVIMVAGLALGANTSVSDGYSFVAAWLSVLGIGLGFSLPPAMDVAMGALAGQRSGSGSALLQAMRQVGGTFGVAILGTVLNAGYRAGVEVGGLPRVAADAVRDTPAAGVQVAAELGSPSLLVSVREAFMTGMGTMLWVCAGFAAVAALLAVAFLPRQAEDRREAQSNHEFVAG